MAKSTENNNQKSFLKESLKGDISKHHKQYLGTDIPENYFAKSKTSILERVKLAETLEKKPLVFWMRPQFRYMAAASLVFILSITVWLQNANKTTPIITTDFELLAFSDDILINSLMVEDSELEAFAENTLMNEVVIKAELSEQNMDNLILNSLIIEDSLLDNYMEYQFVETIIL